MFLTGDCSTLEVICCCCCAVLGEATWVAQTDIIAQNPKVTAINTCIEADLTGQVCADSMGTQMYTGTQHIIICNTYSLAINVNKICFWNVAVCFGNYWKNIA